MRQCKAKNLQIKFELLGKKCLIVDYVAIHTVSTTALQEGLLSRCATELVMEINTYETC